MTRTPESLLTTGATQRTDASPFARRQLLLVFGFWTFFALLTIANRLLAVHGVPYAPGSPPLAGIVDQPSWPIIAFAFVESYAWALLTPLIFWLASRYPLERAEHLWRLLVFAAACAAAVVVVEILSQHLAQEIIRAQLSGVRRGRPGFPRGLPGLGPGFDLIVVRLPPARLITDVVFFIGVLSAGFARDYFFKYRARRDDAIRLQTEAAELEAETAALKAQLANAKLSVLRTQLNPHFLFNTLHAVSSLVDVDPKGVRRMIARLSELLRFSLEESNAQEIPLARELDVLDRYLEIMQIRFQETLAIEKRIDPDVLDALVPTLVLQPLVENAAKHGVGQVAGTSRIEIGARREDERLVLSVRDTGPGLASDASIRDGVGLANTRERLSQLYGTEQSFSLRNAAGGGAIAEVSLPFHTRADLYTTGSFRKPGTLA